MVVLQEGKTEEQLAHEDVFMRVRAVCADWLHTVATLTSALEDVGFASCSTTNDLNQFLRQHMHSALAGLPPSAPDLCHMRLRVQGF
jgi:hypothetical protein